MSKFQVKRFIVALSAAEWKPPGTSLRAPPDPLQGVAGSVLHPRSSDLRFQGLRFQPPNRFEIAEGRAAGWFDSPSGSNLLLFARPPAADAVMVAVPGKPLWYERVAASLTPPAIAQRLGELSHRIYRQVRQQPKGEFSPVVVQVDETGQPPDAWLNPVLLEYDIGGDQLRGPDGADRDLMSANRLLAVESDFEPVHRSRLGAWRHLARRLRAGSWEPSIVERLFFGMRGNDAGLTSFHALDALGGIFRLEHTGGETTYFWEPELSLPGNAAWFADHFCGSWGGTWQPSRGPLLPLLPDRQVDGGKPALGEPVLLKPCELPLAVESSLEVLSRPPWSELDEGHPLAFAARVLRDSRRHQWRADRCCEDCYEIGLPASADPEAPSPFHLKPLLFLDWFARRFLLPHSRVLLGLPRNPAFVGVRPREACRAAEAYRRDFADRFLDLGVSFSWSGYELMRQLFEAPRLSLAERTEWEIVFRPGWQWEYFESLFRRPSRGSRICFSLPRRGSVLGKARLGQNWNRGFLYQHSCNGGE